MPAAAPAKPAFDLKSTAWTLTALRLQSADVPTLAAALDARFADSPGLFDNDPVVRELLLKHYDPVYLQSMQRNFTQYGTARQLSPHDHSAAAMAALAQSMLSEV